MLVKQSIDLRSCKGGGYDGLTVAGCCAGEEGLPHTHDVCTMVRLGKTVQGFKDCNKGVMTQISRLLAALKDIFLAKGVSSLSRFVSVFSQIKDEVTNAPCIFKLRINYHQIHQQHLTCGKGA